MKVVTSKPFGMASSETFVGMGIISDSDKDYLCFIDMDKAKKAMDEHQKFTSLNIVSECCYIEEIHWVGSHHTLETASLHQVDDDKEWGALVKYAMTQTDIFSPKKIKEIAKHGVYFYSTNYLTKEETQGDVEHRKKEGIF